MLLPSEGPKMPFLSSSLQQILSPLLLVLFSHLVSLSYPIPSFLLINSIPHGNLRFTEKLSGNGNVPMHPLSPPQPQPLLLPASLTQWCTCYCGWRRYIHMSFHSDSIICIEFQHDGVHLLSYYLMGGFAGLTSRAPPMCSSLPPPQLLATTGPFATFLVLCALSSYLLTIILNLDRYIYVRCIPLFLPPFYPSSILDSFCFTYLHDYFFHSLPHSPQNSSESSLNSGWWYLVNGNSLNAHQLING